MWQRDFPVLAPGPVGHGHPADDTTREVLLLAAQAGLCSAQATPPLTELLRILASSFAELQRTRDLVGAERLGKDERHGRMQRACAWARWLLLQEGARLGSLLSPHDLELGDFLHVSAARGAVQPEWQLLSAALDGVREGLARNPDLDPEENNRGLLRDAGARLFQSGVALAEGASLCGPLEEARQAFDLAYTSLRDTMRAQHLVPMTQLGAVFPDLQHAWRQRDLLDPR